MYKPLSEELLGTKDDANVLTIKGTTIYFFGKVVIRPIDMVRIQNNQFEHGMLTNIVLLSNNTSGPVWYMIYHPLLSGC